MLKNCHFRNFKLKENLLRHLGFSRHFEFLHLATFLLHMAMEYYVFFQSNFHEGSLMILGVLLVRLLGSKCP
jgi:hypothetical protein